MNKTRCITGMIILLSTAMSLASGVTHITVEDCVNDAAVVGVAQVKDVTIKKSRCEINTIVLMEPVEFLKGSLDKKAIAQSYTHHLWAKAFWPWEEECLSVHYSMPPVAADIKGGMKVLFTAEYIPGQKEHQATGTFTMDKLEKIRSLLKK